MAQNTDYSKIFKPETLALLKGKSGESLRQMLGNKNLMQVVMRTPQLLQELAEAEFEYIDELEMLAEIMLKEAYPVIEYSNIKLDLKIIQDVGELSGSLSDDEDEVDADLAPENYKRRVINAISQGAAVRGAFWFMLFREYLDNINPELVEKYKEIMNLSLGIYNDENAIAMILAMLAQKQKMAGGTEEVKYNEEEECFVIKARGLNFAMLVYEGVKGLFEIVGTEGFGQDKEKNKEIVNNVDRLDNEPRDLQLGPHIYDALSNIYNNSIYDDARIRELFFTEVYKLENDEFFNFIENAIHNKLTTSQKSWVNTTLAEIDRDLRADDSDESIDNQNGRY